MTRDINQWVYNGDDGMVANFENNTGLWTETNEQTYYDQLECLPPKAMRNNGFMVGECYSGRSYAAFVEVDGRFFGKICGMLTFNTTKYTEEIRNQFGMVKNELA